MSNIKCSNCSAENDEGFRFCGHCGVPLSVPINQTSESVPEKLPLDSEARQPEWSLPHVAEILDPKSPAGINPRELSRQVQIIENTFAQLGARIRVQEVNHGPRLTQFGIELITTRGSKTRVSQITALKPDLELALSVAPIRFEVPIPGRSIIGIDIPNPTVQTVSVRSLLDLSSSILSSNTLQIGLGQNMVGKPLIADLRTMPHLLVGGATGSGKSVCISTILAFLLLYHSPNALRLILADPKRVELSPFNGVPHVLGPTIADLDTLIAALTWASKEVQRRLALFAQAECRNIENYNVKMGESKVERLPYILVVIDELIGFEGIPDSNVESLLAHILQEGHGAGIHLILSTQRPSAKVLTGLVKSKFLARIAFPVTSAADSRIILESAGAETLQGSGDLLYRSTNAAELVRLQGCAVSDLELERIISFWQQQASQWLPSGSAPPPWIAVTGIAMESDALLSKAIELIKTLDSVSISLLQRKLGIGYPRATRLLQQLESLGLVGPDEGTGKPRALLHRSDANPKNEGE